MENKVCPYLGLIDNPSTFTPYPDRANACYKIMPPVQLAFDHQRTSCLLVFHEECPGYVHGWKDGVPKHIMQHRQPVISPYLREGLPWLLLLIPVIVFYWLGSTGRLSFVAQFIRPSPVSTSTSTPLITWTPTEAMSVLEAIDEPILSTATPTPTAELEIPDPTQPPPTWTPITDNKPMVSVSVETNCRRGPGLQHEFIGALMVGEQAEVVGVSENGHYWVIKNPLRAGECWLWGGYASVVGEISDLPRMTPPPRSTPTPPPPTATSLP